MFYPLYRPMVAEAARRTSLLRLVAGLTTVIAITFIWIAAILFLAAYFGYGIGPAGGTFVVQAESPPQTLVLLFGIAGMGVGTLLAARFWHKRGFRSLAGRGPRFLRHFAVAAGTTLAIATILLILPGGEPIEPNLPPSVWATWLPLAIVAVVSQTSAEELLFRGYLQSQVAARFRHPVVWLGLPALIFGLAHYLPGLPPGAGLSYVVFATLFGLMAGDLTARTGSLGAACGFHFANNAAAIIFITPAGPLSGLALYRSGDMLQSLTLSPLVFVDLAAMLAVWLLIRRLVTV